MCVTLDGLRPSLGSTRSYLCCDTPCPSNGVRRHDGLHPDGRMELTQMAS